MLIALLLVMVCLVPPLPTLAQNDVTVTYHATQTYQEQPTSGISVGLWDSNTQGTDPLATGIYADMPRTGGDPATCAGTQERKTAFHFEDVEIPPGASISDAYLSIEVGPEDFCQIQSLVAEAEILLSFELSVDSDPLSTALFDISNRTLTTARVSATGAVLMADLFFQGNGTHYPSPDLADLIQELVSQPGWTGSPTSIVGVVFQVGSHPIWRPMSVRPRLTVRYSISPLTTRCTCASTFTGNVRCRDTAATAVNLTLLALTTIPSTGAQFLLDQNINSCTGVTSTICSAYSYMANMCPVSCGSCSMQLVSTPTMPPTSRPSSSPHSSQTTSPTHAPSGSPTTSLPTPSPSSSPSTTIPTPAPSNQPSTIPPTDAPSTLSPTSTPSGSPTTSLPTPLPTEAPVTISPTTVPTNAPATTIPTPLPTSAPLEVAETRAPTTLSPTRAPSTLSPTTISTTLTPTMSPTTLTPTTELPTTSPSPIPTSIPTSVLNTQPPSGQPTTIQPTLRPTDSPSRAPASLRFEPTSVPFLSVAPTGSPTTPPNTNAPTQSPSLVSLVTSPNNTMTYNPTSSPTPPTIISEISSDDDSSSSAMIGGIVAVLLLLLIVAAVLWSRRMRQSREQAETSSKSGPKEMNAVFNTIGTTPSNGLFVAAPSGSPQQASYLEPVANRDNTYLSPTNSASDNQYEDPRPGALDNQYENPRPVAKGEVLYSSLSEYEDIAGSESRDSNFYEVPSSADPLSKDAKQQTLYATVNKKTSRKPPAYSAAPVYSTAKGGDQIGDQPLYAEASNLGHTDSIYSLASTGAGGIDGIYDNQKDLRQIEEIYRVPKATDPIYELGASNDEPAYALGKSDDPIYALGSANEQNVYDVANNRNSSALYDLASSIVDEGDGYLNVESIEAEDGTGKNILIRKNSFC